MFFQIKARTPLYFSEKLLPKPEGTGFNLRGYILPPDLPLKN